ncbi:MAG: hypothetical protein IKL52_01605, partial [Candidatus Gastranaerophilales bacterium]|nr:hypothetical protein [Candidatus Gastranaerophilales bacterium]
MKIQAIANNFKINKLSFVKSYPLHFRGNVQKSDSVELSYLARSQAVLLSTEKDLEFHSASVLQYENMVDNFRSDIETLKNITSYFEENETEVEDSEVKEIILSSHKRKQQGLDELQKELEKFFKSKMPDVEISSSLMSDIALCVRKKFRLEGLFTGVGKYVAKEIRYIATTLLSDLKTECEITQYRLRTAIKAAKIAQKSAEHIRYNPKAYLLYDDSLTLAQQKQIFEQGGCDDFLIDLKSDEYENISEFSKEILHSELDKATFVNKKRLIKNKRNVDILSSLIGYRIITPRELEEVYHIDDFEGLFHDYSTLKLGKQELILLQENTDEALALKDLIEGRVATPQALGKL